MAGARAGIYGEAEVNGPIDSGAVSSPKWMDTSSPHFWATVWFLLVVVMLFVA
jgi:hypothetical protein